MANEDKSLEREFRLEELFFSVTNQKGIIDYGNDVFVRVSGFSELELFQKPHNIIRHPEMPRAVFQLLWDYLLAGKPIAAYVKNKAKDGKYYWVVAYVAPVGDYFLSVRFKPTTELFSQVEALYGELRSVELSYEQYSGGRKPGIEASMKLLAERLQSLGFADYDAFMRSFLPLEFANRAKLLQDANRDNKRPETMIFTSDRLDDNLFSTIRRFCTDINTQFESVYECTIGFSALNRRLNEQAESILKTSGFIRLMTLNSFIASQRLGDAGKTLQVLSRTLGDYTQSSSARMADLNVRVKELIPCVREVEFKVTIAKLQVEMIVQFLNELTSGSKQIDEDTVALLQKQIRLLVECFDDSMSTVFPLLLGALAGLEKLAALINELTWNLRTVELVPTQGKVATANLESADSIAKTFDAVLRSVSTFRGGILECLNQVESVSAYRPTIERSEITVKDIAKKLRSVWNDAHQ